MNQIPTARPRYLNDSISMSLNHPSSATDLSFALFPLSFDVRKNVGTCELPSYALSYGFLKSSLLRFSSMLPSALSIIMVITARPAIRKPSRAMTSQRIVVVAECNVELIEVTKLSGVGSLSLLPYASEFVMTFSVHPTVPPLLLLRNSSDHPSSIFPASAYAVDGAAANAIVNAMASAAIIASAASDIVAARHFISPIFMPPERTFGLPAVRYSRLTVLTGVVRAVAVAFR